ncbi:hypothetical protein, partial [Bacillus subtilis]|uniref:hypothetical protein n=1 Tax=Bacillus subtilis TaxID=1423 RepID=UPI001BDB95A1
RGSWLLLLNGERSAPSHSILVAFSALTRKRTLNIAFYVRPLPARIITQLKRTANRPVREEA